MNGELIYLVVPWVLSLVLPYITYRLGLRSQRIHALREYITEIVGDEYPSLFGEIRDNLELLDNYLEDPNINFDFHKLDNMYGIGYDRFMEKHHKDLYLIVDSFHNDILPKFYELNSLFGKLWDNSFDVWSNHLRISLPKESADSYREITQDLCRSINPYYVLPDLLNGRIQKVRDKIEACILNKTSHIYHEKAKRPFVIKGQATTINFDQISNSLIEKAKPDVTNVMVAYKELRELADKEVKGKLLPLLQEYISNPI